jgi:hypothetical protein
LGGLFSGHPDRGLTAAATPGSLATWVLYMAIGLTELTWIAVRGLAVWDKAHRVIAPEGGYKIGRSRRARGVDLYCPHDGISGVIGPQGLRQNPGFTVPAARPTRRRAGHAD